MECLQQRSANKFRKSQIRKFANLKICGPSANLAISRFAICGPNICCNLRTCDLRTQLFFANLKLPLIHHFYPYSYMAFRCLKYYVSKENSRGKPMRIWIRNTYFSLKICGFAICGLFITYLLICDLLTGIPQKLADLQLRNEQAYKKNLRVHL